MKQSYVRILGLALAMFGAAAHSHTVWFEPIDTKTGDYRLMFGGHEGKVESYKPEKLKTVEALDAQGKRLRVTKMVEAESVLIHVDGKPTLLAMHFDNGIHSRTKDGPSVEKAMSELPGATRGSHAVKYHKTIVAWSPLVTQAIGQPFEVIPLGAAKPKAGTAIRVKVLAEGKPVAGVKLGRGEEGANDPVTDEQGIGAFIPQKGFNRIWAGKRYPVEGNPKYTELSYEYSLGFTAE